MEIQVRNVNQAYKRMIQELHSSSDFMETRNGPAYVYPEPVLTTYENPTERILWDSARNANPIFHLMEALWMLAGRNDIRFLNLFNSRMADYSDDGKTLYGAYGYRWHHFFGHNQLDTVIRCLRRDPRDRRIVLSMWSSKDLDWDSKDIPCNTHIYFRAHRDKLNMTVCNRSNDMIWGAYGTNYVHFSILQEYIASCARLGVGRLIQFTNNMHAYAGLFTSLHAAGSDCPDLYQNAPYFVPEIMVTNPDMFIDETQEVLYWIEDYFADQAGPTPILTNPFLYNAIHMAKAWHRRRMITHDGLVSILASMAAKDWRVATYNYIHRNCKLREDE